MTVWNRSPGPAEPLVSSGCVAVLDLARIWETNDTAMTFLADDEAVLEIYLAPGGLVDTAPAGALLIEMSTISPAASARVAAGAGARGLRYIRCPVSGNPAVLASGNVTLIVSGARPPSKQPGRSWNTWDPGFTTSVGPSRPGS